MKKIKIILITFILYIIIGFIIIPNAIKYIITHNISNQLNAKISIKQIYFNPFDFYFKIKNLSLTKQQINIKFDELSTNINLNLLDKNINIKYFQLKNIQITNNNTNTILFQLKTFKLKEINYNLKNRLNINYITINQFNINLIKNNNNINLNILINTFKPKKKQQNIHKSNSKLKLTINNFTIKTSKIILQDINKSFQNTIKQINLNITNINLENKQTKYTFNCNIFNSKFKSKGFFTFNKNINLDSTYKLNNLNLLFINNYLSNYVNFKIKQANLNSDGYIKINQNGLKTDLSFDLYDFNITKNNHSLINWSNLIIKHSKYNKSTLLIKNIILKSPQITFQINKNKTTNFTSLIKETNTKTNKHKKNKLSFDIITFNIKNGILNFSDQSLPLTFSTNIHNLEGNIQNINSNPNNISNINFKGEVNKYGYSKITGTLQNNNIKSYANINMAFENINLSNFNPYSTKFIGQLIQNGKINLNLQYKLKNYKIQGDNKIKINKLKLGKITDQNKSFATALNFAIALLENKDGIIDLDLKVTGDTNKPKFNITEIVWKAFKQSIINIVTSPFKALSSMFGFDTQKIKYIFFEANSSKILPTQKEKLDKIVTILNQKPKLRIIINPIYNTILDTNEKQKYIITNMINDYILDTNSTYAKAIKINYIKLFGKKSFNKLKQNLQSQNNQILLQKAINTMIKSIKIDQKQYKILALNRQNNIYTYLIKHKVNKNQISLNKSIILSNQTKDKYIHLEISLDRFKFKPQKSK